MVVDFINNVKKPIVIKLCVSVSCLVADTEGGT
jgi:hypothetical protein